MFSIEGLDLYDDYSVLSYEIDDNDKNAVNLVLDKDLVNENEYKVIVLKIEDIY
jgi:hypothetical protein